MHKETEYRGKVYPSISAIHASADPKPICPRIAFINRVGRGWPIEEALYTPSVGTKQFGSTSREITVNGITYKNVNDMIRNIRPRPVVSESVFRRRYFVRKVPLMDALYKKTVMPPDEYIATCKYSVKFRGKVYMSTADLYRRVEPRPIVSFSTFEKRRLDGMPLEDCLYKNMSAHSSASNYRKIEYNGKVYNSLTELYKSLSPDPQITLAAFRVRVNRGMSIKEAIAQPGFHLAHGVTYNGKYYKSVKALYNEVHPTVAYQTFLSWIREGMTGDEAAKRLPIPKNRHSNHHLIKVPGSNELMNHAEAERFLGFKKGTINNRLSLGMTLEEALSLPIQSVGDILSRTANKRQQRQLRSLGILI